jgi:hypothetical protein
MRSKKALPVIIAAFAALVLSVTGISRAQNAAAAEIAYGTPVEGKIDSANFTQSWTLTTASADRIAVQAQRTDGNLIPLLFIMDSNNQILNQSYSPEDDAASAVIDAFKLPAAGQYTIQVGRDGADKGVTAGGFKLTVTALATGEDNPQNMTPMGAIAADTPLTGEITATHWYQRYTYDAQAGDSIEIQVKRTSGTLFPEAEVLDVNGSSIATAYVDDSGAFADTTTTLPAKGQYTVAVTRNNRFNGETVGGYEVLVHLVGSGEGSPNLVPLAGKVEYDKALQSKITGARWYEDWQLAAQANDTLGITVARADGTLVPEVILLGGAGQELNHGYADDTGAAATINSYKLQGAGTYTVRVTRAGGQRRETTGAYTLTVKLIGTGDSNPALTNPVGAVTLNTPVTGTITNVQWTNVWTFDNPADGQVVVTVTRTDGTYVPYIEVRDPNGQQLTSGYAEQSRDTANAEINLKAGKYQIAVMRDRGQDGVTTGGYSLSVTPPKQ